MLTVTAKNQISFFFAPGLFFLIIFLREELAAVQRNKEPDQLLLHLC
jgi:hypothetical protein